MGEEFISVEFIPYKKPVSGEWSAQEKKETKDEKDGFRRKADDIIPETKEIIRRRKEHANHTDGTYRQSREYTLKTEELERSVEKLENYLENSAYFKNN